ncbi:MAG TPA: glycosyltransferase, partial [Longimicrobiales bacterium]|nr:glycosyltransferase [Longimicrobiales bacterium]
MTFVVLGLLPWVGFLLFLLAGVRLPRPLPPLRSGVGESRPWPRVSVVIPARNEAGNIRTVLASVTAADYPDFEVVVVDDRSTDGTGEIARATPAARAREVRVVEGADLPEGWMGKPWACHQGAMAATGEVLLFTDADTWHGPGLLRRAVEGLREDGAHMLTVAGRQRMLTLWERL